MENVIISKNTAAVVLSIIDILLQKGGIRGADLKIISDTYEEIASQLRTEEESAPPIADIDAV